MRLGALLLLVLAVTVPAVTAQTLPGAVAPLHPLGIDDGLSQGAVFAVAQDPTGFLWLGTYDGLNRYDGRRFDVFRRDARAPASLSSSEVQALLYRPDALWVGTAAGLDRVDPATGRVRRVPLPGTDGPTWVTSLAEDAQGTVWVGTDGAGLFRVTPGGVVRADVQLPSLRVWSIGPDGSGGLWVGTNEGLSHLPARRSSDTPPRSRTSLPGAFVISLLPDPEGGHLWAGTLGGLFRVDPATGASRRVALGGAAEPRVYALLRHEGDLWVGTSDGLFLVDPGTLRARPFPAAPPAPYGLRGQRVRSLFVDARGSVWIGTGYDGAYRYDGAAGPFAVYRARPSDPASLPADEVWAVHGDPDGSVWVGTARGLARLDPASGRFQRVPIGDPAAAVTAVSTARDGSVWVGTDRAAVVRLAPGSRRPSRMAVPPPASGGAPARVSALYASPDGTLWIGTSDGLCRTRSSGGAPVVCLYENGVGRVVLSVEPSPDGALWIGTYDGLVRFDPASERVTTYRPDPADRASLPLGRVGPVLVQKGDVWAGTLGGGLARLDPSTGHVGVVGVADGLPNPVIQSALADAQGHLWVGTSRGLARLTPSADPERPASHVRAFTGEDGLPGLAFNWGAAGRGADGSLYFGGPSGLIRVRPDRVRPSSFSPGVAVRRVRVDDRPSGSTARATLAPGARALDVDLAALDFVGSDRVRYAHRLDGFEDRWRVSPNPTVSYTALPPGQYLLRVRVTNGDGVWGRREARLAVVVEPPWWQTTWAQALAAVLMVVAAGFGFLLTVRVRERRLRERFDAVLGERTRIAREIHDTLLQGFTSVTLQTQVAADQVERDAPAARVALDAVLRQADRVLVDARQSIWDKRPPALDGRSLPDAVRDGVHAATASATLDVSVDVEGTPARLSDDAEADILRVATEAAANVARHADATRLDVRLVYGEHDLHLIVADDGQGFDVNATRSARAGHWGLLGMHERAARLGGDLHIESSPRAGTRVSLRVPR